MPVDRLEPLGSLQKIPWNVIINDRKVLQPHTWYTCPTGKKAFAKATLSCDSTGASSEAYLEVNGVRIRKWGAGGGLSGYGTNAITGAGAGLSGKMPENTLAVIEFSLNAGETIETTQDGGFTNASFNVLLEIQETSI